MQIKTRKLPLCYNSHMTEKILGLEILDVLPFDTESRQAVGIATAVGKDHVGTEHLLYGLLSTQSGRAILEAVGIDTARLEGLTADYLRTDANKPETQDGFTHIALKALDLADAERNMRKAAEITPPDILIGMLAGKVGMAFLLMRAIAYEHIIDDSPEARERVKAELLESVRIAILPKAR
jgi:ATP-dependent Clp protease ATP-binding subunit ClpA